ncbi:MAG: thioredoxin [Burkholderiaceae bacterium]|nr:thioredoxin [Burkholderiaceae bacterium]
MSSDLIKNVSDASFEADVFQSDKPVLVDFWGEWCAPCKDLVPMLEELAATYEGKLQIVKADLNDNNAIGARFGIRSLPTLMLFRDGQLAATRVGAVKKAELAQFVSKHLA